MKTQRGKLRQYVAVGLIVPAAAVLLVFLWTSQRTGHYRELFSEVRPGMSKIEVTEVVGEPNTIDTVGGEYEVWIYDVPTLLAERPRCYFHLRDSTLVRFAWEPVDTSLAVDNESGPTTPEPVSTNDSP